MDLFRFMWSRMPGEKTVASVMPGMLSQRLVNVSEEISTVQVVVFFV